MRWPCTGRGRPGERVGEGRRGIVLARDAGSDYHRKAQGTVLPGADGRPGWPPVVGERKRSGSGMSGVAHLGVWQGGDLRRKLPWGWAGGGGAGGRRRLAG